MPQPNFYDGAWPSPSRFAWQPDERLLGCSCPKLLGQRLTQPTCEIHGTKPCIDLVLTRVRYV